MIELVKVSFKNIVNFNLEILDEIFYVVKSLESEYPDFYNWYHQKVYEGLKNGTRNILVARDEESQNIVGISILKNSDEKKICTFRVVPEFQHKGIGSELMKKSIGILGTNSPLITVSEDRIMEFQKILEKFNFKEVGKYNDYYRKGRFEISYNGYLNEQLLRDKSYKKSLFSIKPEYAFKILSGEKKFEYRRNRTKENISYMIIYATSPVKKIIGEVTVKNILCGSVENIWELTNKFSGINYDSYLKYFEGQENAYAYHLECPRQYNPYKDLSDFKLGRPPQSYQYL